MATGRWFRYVATTVKVPSVGTYSHYARIVLKGDNVPEVVLGVKPGGGAGSVAYGVGVSPFSTGGHALALAPAPGDTVRIDMYYDKTGGGVTFTAADLTTHVKKTATISEGTKAVFNKVEIGTVLSKPSSPPTGDLRLWQHTDIAVTTYTGVHGTMTGPWTTSVVIDTINGQPNGQVVMSPSALFTKDANFGVWLRDWLMKTGS